MEYGKTVSQVIAVMAIASTDPEPTIPSIILGVVRAPSNDVSEFEKTLRKYEVAILQKKVLEQNLEEISNWFTDNPSDDPSIETIGYVLQAYNVTMVWSQIAQEIGTSVCGQAPHEILKEEFPSTVTDAYLLQPAWTKQFLKQLKPVLIEGLRETCRKKPDDPVQFLADLLSKGDH